jgi:hypothetical protein
MTDKQAWLSGPRARVSGDEEYEVGYLARKFGLSTDQVRELIKKHGNSRETLE